MLPGRPFSGSLSGGTITFTAPGDDLLCGTADRYQIVTSDNKITGANFSKASSLAGAPTPAAAGTQQSYSVPAGAKRYVAIRARDERGYVGLPLLIDRSQGATAR
jgi:hypothetical protein